MEKLIPGATIALGILYFGKWSEKLPTGAIEPNFPFIEPDWIYLTTTELEKLIPGATIALGILYFGKRSEKLPTGAMNPQRFQLGSQNISRLRAPISLSLRTGESIGDRRSHPITGSYELK